MKEDYFFAPQLKLTVCSQIIRCYALLAAALLNLWIMSLYISGIIEGRVKVDFWSLFPYLVAVSVQTIISLPFWRCFLLKRWACMSLGGLPWLLVFIGVFLQPLGALAFSLFLFPFTLAVLVELPDLKSGF